MNRYARSALVFGATAALFSSSSDMALAGSIGGPTKPSTGRNVADHDEGDVSPPAGPKCHWTASATYWGMSCGGGGKDGLALIDLLNGLKYTYFEEGRVCFYVVAPVGTDMPPKPVSGVYDAMLKDCISGVIANPEGPPKWKLDGNPITISSGAVWVIPGSVGGTSQEDADPIVARDGSGYPKPYVEAWPSSGVDGTQTRVNVPTYFWLTKDTERSRTKFFAGGVGMRVRLVDFTISPHDGGPDEVDCSADSGPVGPEEGHVPAKDPGDCAALYTSAGEHAVDVTAYWKVQLKVGMGDWQDTSPKVFKSTNTLGVTSQDVQTVIVP